MKPTGWSDIYDEGGGTAGTEIRNLSINTSHCDWIKPLLVCNY